MPHKIFSEKAERCIKRENGKYNIKRQEENFMDKMTKVEDISITVKDKIWTWPHHTMSSTDKRWTAKVIERHLKNCGSH